jgi:hypothetical protein
VSSSRWAVLALVLAAGCRPALSDGDAGGLVRRYCERVVEAYRASDAELVAPLVGDAHAKKLTGLIGVKRDMDVVLDAKLLELALERVERSGDGVLVFTRERWRYVDRSVGSGEPAGPVSNDAYRLRYRLGREKDRWVVREIDFVEPPVVERGPEPAPALDARKLHGLPPRVDE